MKLFIDISAINEVISNGHDRFAHNIIGELIKLKEWDITLISQTPKVICGLNAVVLVKRVLWLDWTVPRYLNAIKERKVYLNLTDRSIIPVFKCSRVMVLHDMDYKTFLPLPKIMSYLLIFRSLLLAGRVVSVSDYTHHKLKSYMALEKFSGIVGEGVAEFGEGIRHPKTPSENFILSVGSFHRRKQYMDTIRVFAKVVESFKGYKLLIVGKDLGTLLDCRNLINKLGLESSVSIVSGMDDRQLSYCYKNCDFFIQLPHSEGFGLPVIEAFSYGKTGVVTNAGNLPYIAQGCALICDNNDDDKLNNIIKLLRNTSLKSALEANANTKSTNYSWKISANKLSDILKEEYMRL